MLLEILKMGRFKEKRQPRQYWKISNRRACHEIESHTQFPLILEMITILLILSSILSILCPPVVPV